MQLLYSQCLFSCQNIGLPLPSHYRLFDTLYTYRSLYVCDRTVFIVCGWNETYPDSFSVLKMIFNHYYRIRIYAHNEHTCISERDRVRMHTCAQNLLMSFSVCCYLTIKNKTHTHKSIFFLLLFCNIQFFISSLVHPSMETLLFFLSFFRSPSQMHIAPAMN